MIAYHLPPLAGSSGIQRTLRFAQYLPRNGWEPLLLTVHPRAYERTSDDLMRDLPEGVVLRRAFALDTARHLTLGGRYVGATARPDRWVSWRFDGVRQGLKMIREFEPQAIWSTYPIATAHLIGAALQRKSGLPWIADFRDPMAQPDQHYPSDPATFASFVAIEKAAAAQATRMVFTTPGALRDYRQRYPQAGERMALLENGYDEESFATASAAPHAARRDDGPLVLLHSGVVYPAERDPTQFFEALGRLRRAGQLTPEQLRIRFRAAVHDAMLRDTARAHGAEEFIEMVPPVPYREALAEMLGIDALLVMQASNCNAQIPAKLYEYLRAGRPILGLTDPAGDTAWALRSAGIEDVVALDSTDAIVAALPGFVERLRANRVAAATAEAVARASRESRTQELAAMLDDATRS